MFDFLSHRVQDVKWQATRRQILAELLRDIFAFASHHPPLQGTFFRKKADL